MAKVRYSFGQAPGYTPDDGLLVKKVKGTPPKWFTVGVTYILDTTDLGGSLYEPSPRYEKLGISNPQSISSAVLSWDLSDFLLESSCAFGLWIVFPGDVNLDKSHPLYAHDMDQWYSYLQVGENPGPLDGEEIIKGAGVTGVLLDDLKGSAVSGSHKLQIPKMVGPEVNAGAHQVGAETVRFVVVWARDAKMKAVLESMQKKLWIDFEYAPGAAGDAGNPSQLTAGTPAIGSVRS